MLYCPGEMLYGPREVTFVLFWSFCVFCCVCLFSSWNSFDFHSDLGSLDYPLTRWLLSYWKLFWLDTTTSHISFTFFSQKHVWKMFSNLIYFTLFIFIHWLQRNRPWCIVHVRGCSGFQNSVARKIASCQFLSPIFRSLSKNVFFFFFKYDVSSSIKSSDELLMY